MVKLYVKNWRCIEEVEITLAPITVFLGKNSSGKSSLAYAAYFLTKVIEQGNPKEILMRLYGVSLNKVVRRQGGKKFYPLIVKMEEDIYLEADGTHISLYKHRPGPLSTGYLLPSQRVYFFRMLQFLFKRLRRRAIERIFKTKQLYMIVPPMHLFLEDFMKLYIGRKFLEQHELGGLGTVVEKITPLLALIIYEYTDPFIENLKLPLDLASDGLIDSAIIRIFVDKAQENSLLVIEEPENHKNPVQLIELTKYIAEEVIKRKLTVIITTHNDIIVRTLAKAVEERKIRPSDVAVYYFERGPENPWTRVRKLEIYEDGSIEELPDAEKIITALF